jgi:DNA (cytosine-5)-methyltransferase 1
MLLEQCTVTAMGKYGTTETSKCDSDSWKREVEEFIDERFKMALAGGEIPGRLLLGGIFTGMGGWEVAAGEEWKQVFSAEIDRHARTVFEANFGIAPQVRDIITARASSALFAHVYTVSFPCQSSSQAGVRKGRRDARGEGVLSKALQMVKHARPILVVLENVKGFLTVEQGGYFNWLRSELHAIGYPRFEWKLLATHHFGLPQQRERLYMVAFREDIPASVDFRFPVGDVTKTHTLSKFLHKPGLARKYAKTIRCGGRGSKDRHAWDMVPRVKGGWYKLSVTDCKRLMGFPRAYKMPVSRTQQFRLLGNAITAEPARSLLRECKRVVHEVMSSQDSLSCGSLAGEGEKQDRAEV